MGVVTEQLQQQGGITQVLVGLLNNNSEVGGLAGLTDKLTPNGTAPAGGLGGSLGSR